MIVNSLKKTVQTMVSKPFIFLPMFIATIASLASMNLTSFVLEKPLSEMLLNIDIIMTSDLIAIMFNRYLFEFVIMILSGFVVFLISIIAFFILARFAKKENLVEAINSSIIEISKLLHLTFFVFVVGFLTFVVFQIFLFVLSIVNSFLPEEINFYLTLFAIPIILALLIIIILTKLFFVMPALIDNKIKDSIKKSWDFTNDKFWNCFLYIIIVLFLGVIILSVFTNLGIIFEIDFLFVPIGEIISMTFIGLALSYYYFD